MGDHWAGTGFDRAGLTESVLQRWLGFREGVSPAEGDRRFHGWLFGPELTGASDADGHALFVFEMALGMAEREMTTEAFVLLRWLGETYIRHPDPGVVRRMVSTLTEDCFALGVRNTADNELAREVLRAVVDQAAPDAPAEVERAVCQALVHVAHLRGETAGPRENKIVDVRRLWREIAERWSASADPELRERAAQGWTNTAAAALQSGDEAAAREAYAEIVRRFGDDRPAAGSELERWLAVAGNAPGLLDGLHIGDPEFQLAYLERQRHFHPGDRMEILVEAARQAHVNSAGAVRAWVCSGQPFVLLLRNFELTERSGISDSEFVRGEEGGDHVQILTHRKSEGVLTELAGGVPLVQVASTTAGELEVNNWYGGFVAPHRLYLPTASWFDTVRSLIAVADQIIVWADELTPSLARELGELTARGRCDDTLILMEEANRDPFAQIYLPRRAGEPLTPDHPVLADFPHRLDGTTLEGRTVRDTPLLMRLVERLREAALEPAVSRLPRTRARLDAVDPQPR
ncbi:hypothetical protein GCM10027445_41810 [Amycolatopsis endophytica]|uniref:Uncharacterized protein n=1 Tax=Amycolatopsis endophytica TaxID=860233 RepID=A0A853B796_9PSEU|nr:hypothetical protein [Amycolatopsis endophytica]NYI90591.1 hypothetical protein [Amycolatopsis endophytica]